MACLLTCYLITAAFRTFTLFSKDAEAGVSIPYPSISIHAVKQIGSEGDANRTQAVWMQLEFSDGGQDDDEFNNIDLTIVPPTAADPEAVGSPVAPKLYEAIANCSNLHPDPRDEDDGEDDGEDDPYDRIIFEGSAEHEAIEGFTGVLRGAADGSLPPPMPGSGGWITAENVHEYFDEDGNWIGQGAEEELGDGAGRTRGREELEDGDADGSGPDETKRPRVD
jgi:chloride channel, nucleotide-sensitive, 1A